MSKKLIATVYVEKTDFSFDRPFDYVISDKYLEKNLIGCRVLVPFGQSNKERQGIIVKTSFVEVSDKKKLKAVTMLLEENALLNEEQLKMCEFMVKNTFATFYSCVKTILPRGSNVVYQRGYILSKNALELDLNLLTYEEQKFLQFLSVQKSTKENVVKKISKNIISQKQVDAYFSKMVFGDKDVIIENLLDLGIIEMIGMAKPEVFDKTSTAVMLTDDFVKGMETKLSKKQGNVVEFLEEIGFATTKEVMYFCGVTEIVIKNLIKMGVVKIFDIEVFRTPNSEITEHMNLSDITLTKVQQDVFDGISDMMNENKPNVALLHGITGSGKTQVYIKLIQQCVSQGKQALMLVPEIALTPQMVGKFKSLFGEKVAVMHSNLSVGERLDEYKRVKQGIASIVVGTRSAVFMPFSSIGVIIMDEEGENSYKSDASPRYHAREIAKFRSVYHKSLLVLGSATPSVESYYKAKTGLYKLFTINERFSNRSLPEVYIVDMKDEEKNANTTSISRILQKEIRANIEKKEQSILFLNRRGYNTVVTCIDCGHVVKCPHCDVALTYHKANGYMMCHYCGYSQSMVKTCPECHNHSMKLNGLGTQKIEDDLEKLFSGARILRIDTDTTMSKYSLPKQLEKFKNGEYDILVGTQMIAKGLDFPNVTLVGVLNVDQGLYVTDYRCVERVFSLITQVVGRSGRANKLGRAYIQTYEVDNATINYGAKQDYIGFYEDEIVTRQMLKYPPFFDICVASFVGADENSVTRASNQFMRNLAELAKKYEGKIALKALGPVEASIYRVNGKYRKKVIIKCKFQKYMKLYLKELMQSINCDKNFKGVALYIDVNGDINT